MRRDVFQAIADPTRRAIMLLIAAGEMTPNEMAAQFNISRQAISRHLRILTECGLLTQVQSGKHRYYRLDNARLLEIGRWLEQFSELWTKRYAKLEFVLSTIKNRKT